MHGNTQGMTLHDCSAHNVCLPECKTLAALHVSLLVWPCRLHITHAAAQWQQHRAHASRHKQTLHHSAAPRLALAAPPPCARLFLLRPSLSEMQQAGSNGVDAAEWQAWQHRPHAISAARARRASARRTCCCSPSALAGAGDGSTRWCGWLLCSSDAMMTGPRVRGGRSTCLSGMMGPVPALVSHACFRSHLGVTCRSVACA